MAKSASNKKSIPTTSSSSTTTSAASSSVVLKEVKSTLTTTINNYFDTISAQPRLKLIDLFLIFLVLLGILQFIYVLIIGNFPFNSFLGGFISCVGQFVLLVSLRLQINDSTTTTTDKESDDQLELDEDKIENGTTGGSSGGNGRLFKEITPERSFGDFIFASLILHFIVIHFIN
ncbi:oligosaccharyltransferase complex subunit epsilon [Candida albicans P57072]|nr:oligosaccharyltransferase complex subunit epsilon [Candida albicans P57072]KHC38605.1 oligosaccharyltransferase complex subunit epsilon [Candida albicans P76055]KHC40049.1 oligosaccharyltransferase complex subunit epsilon [Candida albicans P76067]